ncbi:MAG: hypothetical protein OXC94_05025 [Chloroflexi bacterium]|nr:hypothetical protein [Chloroflexota bacterium]
MLAGVQELRPLPEAAGPPPAAPHVANAAAARREAEATGVQEALALMDTETGGRRGRERRMWSRGNGRRRPASVQELLPVEEIAGDVVRLRGGEYRAVLEAQGVHFALKSEPEQEAILAGYRRFLNGLAYPLQVLVRVVPADVEGYLAALGDARRGTGMLRSLARDHEAFVRRVARERTLLDRRFYVVVPAEVAVAPGRNAPAWPGLRSMLRSGAHPTRRQSDLQGARRTLAFRSAEVAQSLGAFGVNARRLGPTELAALWRDTLGGASGGSAGREVLDAGPVVTQASAFSGRREEASRA